MKDHVFHIQYTYPLHNRIDTILISCPFSGIPASETRFSTRSHHITADAFLQKKMFASIHNKAKFKNADIVF